MLTLWCNDKWLLVAPLKPPVPPSCSPSTSYHHIITIIIGSGDAGWSGDDVGGGVCGGRGCDDCSFSADGAGCANLMVLVMLMVLMVLVMLMVVLGLLVVLVVLVVLMVQPVC